MLNEMQSNLNETFKKALIDFINNEEYLYSNNASERAIAHRLALYLQHHFSEYHVDCEYNLNLLNYDTLRKEIPLTIPEAEFFNKKITDIDLDRDGIAVSVYPDIIVHERGNNSNNKIIIEIKKSTNTSLSQALYDQLKLEKYTSIASFKYELGIFLIINTKKKSLQNNSPKYEIEYWSDGKKILP